MYRLRKSLIFYPRLEMKIHSILNVHTSKPIAETSKRTDRDIMEEIPELTRRQYTSKAENAEFKKTSNKNYVYIDRSEFKENSVVELPIYDNLNFRDFLDEVYHILSDYVKAFTYEYDWILYDKKNGEYKISTVKLNDIQRGSSFFDYRNTYEAGIEREMTLIAKKL